jgi:glutamine amidotransferase
MANLRQLELVDPFVERVKAGVPTLGICLGMHLLFTESAEFGLHRGLDLIPGRVDRLPERLRVPHMGWNQLFIKRENGLTRGINEASFVYFVHSYFVNPRSEAVILATTDYEMEFPAIVHSENIWATQFHPEKSQHVGERLLDNFARL